MKKIILSISFCLFGAIAFAQTAYTGQKFGEEVKPGDVKPAAKMEAAMGNKKTAEMKIEGKVVDVCKKKGCWMTLEMPNGDPMRVTFKDYAFFMPKDIVGKNVVLDGLAKKQTISVETLRHYAEDAKKTPEEVAKITDPKKELAFEAKGVVILDK
ncbi:DUF4920 domain-containing protein [Pedobacter sp. HDW13]|uniref:DUF4920 domain-containing protein n=1 Tax=unclassified Pedobacter TaxID=2628915 RepID=UPI000F5A3E6D|nr:MULTISPECIES: DUF4920 domain-containing protein [unclassified Pedobacter]QIL39704.1 DUF4920 domain-containing protein [Pedobacter sp. HDW13]RQO79815.1 DUF4920 domain-containing protein [Pedobacter sp. KBW01]